MASGWIPECLRGPGIIIGSENAAQKASVMENATCITITAQGLERNAAQLAEEGLVLIDLFCEEGFFTQGLTLVYVFEKRGQEKLLMLLVPIAPNTGFSSSSSSSSSSRYPSLDAPSISKDFPTASWYEREIMDGFGVAFPANPDQRRLFLHERYPAGFHPLRKQFKNRTLKANELLRSADLSTDPSTSYPFRRMEGEGVYEIPVGPVHAGIIEPGHFRFSVIGETVYNLEVRMFYKHRGVEKLTEGKTPDDCVPLAEAISGDETAANSVAFCAAVESIYGTRVPKRAVLLRAILLELERVYSLLNDLSGMVTDVAYPVGAAPFYTLREEMLRINRLITGSRFLKGIVAVGGLSHDIPAGALGGLRQTLPGIALRFERAVQAINAASFVIDRFATTGVVKQGLVAALNITGPIARASGVLIDTRADHPYGAYAGMRFGPIVRSDGDVLARFMLKADEALASIGIIMRLLKGLPEGSVRARATPRDGFALSLVEAPRGQSVHFVAIKDGLVHRYKARTPSFCNWRAIEHAVLGNIVPDFPLINKSMNLSYAGTDL